METPASYGQRPANRGLKWTAHDWPTPTHLTRTLTRSPESDGRYTPARLGTTRLHHVPANKLP